MVNYDPEGRPVLFINPDGTIAQKHHYAPSGRLARIEDPNYSQVPHEAIIPLEFQAGGGFRDLETMPRSEARRNVYTTLGGRALSAMSYLGLNISPEGIEAFGPPLNFWAIDPYINFVAGKFDGLANGLSGGLYKGQAVANFLGADSKSVFYLYSHIKFSLAGPMALAAEALATRSVATVASYLAVEAAGLVDAVLEGNQTGVATSLIGLAVGSQLFKQVTRSASALQQIEGYANFAAIGKAAYDYFTCEDGEECFVPGTKVLTKSGRKAIEELKLGDEVLSRDEETGQQAYKPITTRFRGQTSKVVRLTLVPRQARQNGRGERHSVGSTKTGNSEEGSDPDPDPNAQSLRCTPKHPFYVNGRGWIQAEFLNVGDELVGSEGGDWEVAETKLVWESSETYNLEVADWHTFFVVEGDKSSEGLWVHNAKKFKFKSKMPAIWSSSWNQFQRATATQFKGPNSRQGVAEAWRKAKQAIANGQGRIPKPSGARDQKLIFYIEGMYHGANLPTVLGHGGTADAFRIERVTGVRLMNRSHEQAARNFRSGLINWYQKASSTASSRDQDIAIELFTDLDNALNGR